MSADKEFFLKELKDLEKQRPMRCKSVKFNGKTVPRWYFYEMTYLHNVVTDQRKLIHKRPLKSRRITDLDKSVDGHRNFDAFAEGLAGLVAAPND